MRGRPPKGNAHHLTHGGVLKGRGTSEPEPNSRFRKLGPARNDLQPHLLSAFNKFKAEMPWLCESDRSFVELACALRTEFETNGDMHNARMGLYRQVLSQLGGTPADRHRVSIWPDAGQFDRSEAGQYFL